MRHGPRAVGYAILTFNFDAEFGGLEGMLTDLYVRRDHPARGLDGIWHLCGARRERWS